MGAPNGQVYPLAAEEYPPYTFDLVVDVIAALEKRGYPVPDGADLIDLQCTVYGFLYGPDFAGREPRKRLLEPETDLAESV